MKLSDLPALRAKAKNPSKLHNKRTVIDGQAFGSKAEARRGSELKVQERMGIIEGLAFQVRYPLVVNDVLVCTYIADAVYRRDGINVVEDTKGNQTDVFRIKSKLMKACHGIDVKLLTKQTDPRLWKKGG